ncbi:uncharacterized protein MKS88_000213 [Plasmodium brasilianum]|uniref:uncharacterized protein n=1 Tax=Plasmodium brasilianum TaxID=5824 RepID=UPI00350E5A75|nr:hypothetical protein MKS88_000213 [Plasmodium brasilianum]
MEQRIKLILLIKIAVFIILMGICHFKKDVRMFNKSLNENYKHDKKLVGNFRLLGKYKQYNDSNTTVLKEDMSSNGGYEKKYITNNKTVSKRKNEKSNKNILNKAQYYIEVVDYNNGMFDGKHFHFDKKWIKKKDYDYFLEKNRRIRDIALKKIKFKNYGFGVAIFIIFLLFGIGVPLSPGIPFLSVEWNKFKQDPFGYYFYYYLGKIPEYVQPYFYIILFSLLIIILSIIFIVTMYKILRNNEKFIKFNLMPE